jgi:hypothetical protein
MHRSVVVVAGIVACALIAACGGGGDDDDEATSTPSVAVTVPAATETATPAGIRSIDLQNSEPVQDLIDVTGGLYVQDNVLYADLSEDGSEEAIVPLSSGGTLGDVGFLVLAEADGGVEPLLTVTPEFGGIAVSLVDGQLTTIEPVPGPDDPECCPSALRTTVYAWNGSELAVESSNTEPSDGSGATTPEGG